MSNILLPSVMGISQRLKSTATGGNIITSGGYTYHQFKTHGTYQFVVQRYTGLSSVEYLIVGGGGGGASGNGTLPGSGGGAGHVNFGQINLNCGTYTVTVGSGGSNGSNGGFSQFFDKALGGTAGSITNGGNSIYNGGIYYTSKFSHGGGGGGTNTAGSAGNALNPGLGGSGSVWYGYQYGGGGGGGISETQNGPPNNAGPGGGGKGGYYKTNIGPVLGGNGTANTGGGGGGGHINSGGGSGGSGIVVIRYLTL